MDLANSQTESREVAGSLGGKEEKRVSLSPSFGWDTQEFNDETYSWARPPLPVQVFDESRG